MALRFFQRGSFDNTERFLKKLKNPDFQRLLETYGLAGVRALESTTPADTGLTASSWSFGIRITGKGFELYWSNSHVVDGVPVVILLQYGHATTGGSYVAGEDFINPTMRPIFDRLKDAIWKEVTG